MASTPGTSPSDAALQPGTIGELVEFLIGRPWKQEPTIEFLGWPPDTFGIAAYLLRESGAYVRVLGEWPPTGRFENLGDYAAWVKQQSQQWLAQVQSSKFESEDALIQSTEVVADLWKEVHAKRDQPLREMGDSWKALVQLCGIADDASQALVPLSSDSPAEQAMTWDMRQWILDHVANPDWTFSNLCSRDVSRENIRVLPKMRTPQNGITLRSLSHNLALLPNAEVEPRWQFSKGTEALRRGMNLLVFPWPLGIRPGQFQPVKPRPASCPAAPFRFFEFDSSTDAEVAVTQVEQALRIALEKAERIDAVIFPEMALDVASFESVIQFLDQKDIKLLIGGVYERPGEDDFAMNQARIVRFDEDSGKRLECTQHKHHRWMLDKNQIEMYGLQSMLDPDYGWWEHIGIQQRTIEFLQLDQALTIAVLICEDLARPDPVGDTIRAVGPNLVIGLLQDGPQLARRWSARYATVLADDPGCSVLTLTGLGMASLSQPKTESANVKPPSRVVALWKQSDKSAREITLEEGAEALVLCLSHETRKHWTADGRHDGDTTGHITLSEVYSVNVD